MSSVLSPPRPLCQLSSVLTPRSLSFQVLTTCDDEMIGSVANLQTLAEAGLLQSVFKPVIAESIVNALSTNGATSNVEVNVVTSAAPTPTAASHRPIPIKEIRRLLMLNGQETWGSEASLRERLEMFSMMSTVTTSQWDTSSQAWAVGGRRPKAWPAPREASVKGAQRAPQVAPPQPVKVAPSPAPAAVPAAVAAPAPAAPAPAPEAAVEAPAPAAPVEAPPAAPADPNKSTHTVTLRTPEGEKSFECDPEMYILDQTEELDNADDFEDLPYACRAGACSACAGKLVSGTMDTSGCSFLTDAQKADGWVLTCTAKPTSDVIIETDKEDDLY